MYSASEDESVTFLKSKKLALCQYIIYIQIIQFNHYIDPLWKCGSGQLIHMRIFLVDFDVSAFSCCTCMLRIFLRPKLVLSYFNNGPFGILCFIVKASVYQIINMKIHGKKSYYVLLWWIIMTLTRTSIESTLNNAGVDFTIPCMLWFSKS